jgi:hypothetical protein
MQPFGPRLLSHQHQALPQKCAHAFHSHRRFISTHAAAAAAAAAEAAGQQRRQPVSTSSDFARQLQLLAAWRSQYGSCYVPRCAADAAGLADWVTKVRQAGRKGQLTEHHRQQLDALEFVWKPDVVRCQPCCII